MFYRPFAILLFCICMPSTLFPQMAIQHISHFFQISTTPQFFQMISGIFALIALFNFLHTLQPRQRKIFSIKKTSRLTMKLMNKKNSGLFLLCISIFAFSLISFLPNNAQASLHMVSVSKDNVNLRTGPGTRYRIAWHLDKGYPLMVLSSKNKWYRVKDFEGDIGWIYKSLTTRAPHVVVKKGKINVRSRPTTKSSVIAKAYKGVVFKTIASSNGWVKVQHDKGLSGWVLRKLVWGW